MGIFWTEKTHKLLCNKNYYYIMSWTKEQQREINEQNVESCIRLEKILDDLGLKQHRREWKIITRLLDDIKRTC